MFDERINTIWLDMDGVLADFDKRAEEILGMPPSDYENTYGTESFWKMIESDPDFFRNLELMPDAMDLYLVVHQFSPSILTGIPKHIDCVTNQKTQWAHEHFPEIKNVFCCQSSKKWTFCQHGDILIDDRYRYAKKWEAAGGTFIHHKSAMLSIVQLLEMRII